jgi:hypothetical protein
MGYLNVWNQTFNTGTLWARVRSDAPTLRLIAAYERVRIGAAETKWKPNGNIAAPTDSAINASF